MTVTVVTPPDPFVLPADIRNSTNDSATAAIIAAVTETIDGPTGWLGRALGEQTLKLTLPEWGCGPIRLPYPPVTGVTWVKYLDEDLNEQTVDETVYRLADNLVLLKPDQEWPDAACQPDAVRIQYAAGYSEVPARAKHAVILTVQHLLEVGGRDLLVRREDVEGIGETEWVVSAQASELIRKTSDSLLAGLRVWS